MSSQTTGVEREDRDLGFGAVVSNRSKGRLLNRDGTFNVERTGLGFWASLHPYYSLLTMSWPRFLVMLGVTYLAINALFALGYMACGPEALPSSTDIAGDGRFLPAFFFSVQTLSTVGYGQIVPRGMAANLVMTLESMVGLLGLALAAGLVFSRFSRPTVKIAFSERALVAPYRGIKGFQFRIANKRRNQLVELEARVIMSRIVRDGERAVRKYDDLELERRRVTFFPASWTIVHPIDEKSPLFGLEPEDCHFAEAEFLVLLTGIDETFSQVVHSRTSYRAEDVVWNAKFDVIFEIPDDDGPLAIDLSRLGSYHSVASEPEQEDAT